MGTTTAPTQQKKGIRGGTARRAKQTAAKSGNLRPPGRKVRTRAVQAKKDKNVFRCSHGKYKTVVEMQKAGKEGTSNTAKKKSKKPNDV